MLWIVGCGAPDLPQDGVLAACPSSPNCVSSQADPADSVHYIAPLPLGSDPSQDMERLVAALEALPGATAAQVSGAAARVSCKTPSGLFTDDVDAVVTPTAIDVRSSSRVGYGDLGVNRERIEALRAAW